MPKQIFKNWIWYEDWKEIKPTKSKLNFKQPIKINLWLKKWDYFMKEAEQIWQEIDNHNLKQEQKESFENKKELENITKNFLKKNNLV